MNFYVDEIYFYFIYFLLTFAINLDHGKSYEDIMLGINSGFTSIMVDRSSLSYEDNIAQTKETVKMCRPLNISVEAELGHVGQGEIILPMVLIILQSLKRRKNLLKRQELTVLL